MTVAGSVASVLSFGRSSVRNIVMGAVMTALGAAAAPAQAAEYPDQAIQMVLSFPPGGATDFLARELAVRLGDKLGQSVVVVNRPGAAGLVGMQAAARSNADGYNLYIASVGSSTIYEAINGKQRVSLDDFDAVGGVAVTPHVLVTSHDLNLKSVDDLIGYLKGGERNYAATGAGTMSNLEGEIFKEQTKTDALLIPYKGSGQAMPELITGTSAFMFDSIASSLPQKETGRIKMLAVASPTRMSFLPDVPTFKELGIDGLETANLFTLMVPKGTPPERTAKVEKALTEVRADKEFQDKIAESGFAVSDIAAADTHKAINDQSQFWLAKARELKLAKE